ncbi:MAG: LON peptidase substrate-binding domain-containing protein [Akkermansiaceae bacterium]|nr:LON peptidase substrate-binding domain-containing protein [Armatimonadota bacterium]
MDFPDDPLPPRPPGSHGVSELPLFPLDLVLFPGMKMSLHIFEERYKEMIGRCLDGSRLFGVVLLRAEQQLTNNPSRAKTFRVGCSARILHVEQLAEGRMNIEIEGVDRFRLIEQHEVESYRTGIVETLEDRPTVGAAIEITEELREEVQTLLKEFLTRQLALMGQRIVEFDLPKDPAILSLITACILPIENGDKQTLLEMLETAERLDSERDILRRAITRLRRSAAAGGGKHSKTKGETQADDTTDAMRSFEQIHADRYRDYVCGN